MRARPSGARRWRGLTYQRLFRRYIRLAGMTGTAREVAREISSVYGLDVVRIPLHRPSRRMVRPCPICRRRERRNGGRSPTWFERLAVAGGRPVLIGTRSVRASEEISAVLGERGIRACAAQRQAGSVGGRGGRARRTARAGDGGDEHGRTRHRHSPGTGRSRARRPACHPDRIPRVAADRSAVVRPLCAAGRSRQLRSDRFARRRDLSGSRVGDDAIAAVDGALRAPAGRAARSAAPSGAMAG